MDNLAQVEKINDKISGLNLGLVEPLYIVRQAWYTSTHTEPGCNMQWILPLYYTTLFRTYLGGTFTYVGRQGVCSRIVTQKCIKQLSELWRISFWLSMNVGRVWHIRCRSFWFVFQNFCLESPITFEILLSQINV